MTEPNKDDDPLAPFFDAARADERLEPSEDFLARLEAQAEAAALAPARPGVAPARGGLLGLIGGWAGVGGMAAAAMAGVWIGVAPPSALPDPGLYWTQDQTSALLYDDWAAFAALETTEGDGDE